MGSTIAAKAPLSLMDKFKAYHAKHPIIVAYGILCSISGAFVIYKEYNSDRKMQCITKYKTRYIVLRPDDPRTTMIKRGRIGLDY